jgi:RimJ/RimL family protein N-acetyltransferase
MHMRIRDGSTITVRPLSTEDGPALLAFYRGMPEEDRQYLREDVTNPEVIKRRIADLDHTKISSLIAEKDGRIIGLARLHFNEYGWRKRMADIRCAVAREYQKKGIGTMLMRQLLSHAEEKGVERISAEMLDSQVAIQKVFRRLGFSKVGELKDYATDIVGKRHNLVVMVNDVSQLWETMEQLLVDYDVSPER